MTVEQASPQRDSERPLITFLLMAYNQERFIGEAVAGAFAQSYTPLEILLTDDCSSDRTYQIMSEMAATYQGPHRIVLNRNPNNLGIGAHINRAVDLANGVLIVASAGDDFSAPERTALMFEHWQVDGVRADSLFSDAFIVDENGRSMGRLFAGKAPQFAGSVEDAVARGGVGVAGCTHIFSKRSFESFGPMDPEVMAEDMVIPFRSLLGGGIRYVDAPLVSYRIHGDNTSIACARRPSRARRARDAQNTVAVLHTWLKDVRKAAAVGAISRERESALRELIVTDYYWSLFESRTYSSSLLGALFVLLRDSAKRLGKVIDRRRRTQM